MTVSELIQILESVRSTHGDIEVIAGCESEGISGVPTLAVETWKDRGLVAIIDFDRF